MSICNVLNNTMKVNKEHNLNSSDLQEMCSAWKDKVICIRGPPSLKKNACEEDNYIKMMKYKEIDDNLPCGNKIIVDII
ncbi:21185_t:CDS:1, partial [Dentiscutata erythropus]